MSESRHRGHVKFFNSIKGYGFILPDTTKFGDDDNTEEVFVHHTAIQNSGGFKSLAEGEQVEYDLVQGPKGMQASNVTGPNGSSVQGDPRTHRQQQQPYPSGGNNGYPNDNRAPYNGGYMVDPFGSSFGYGGVPGYPYMGQHMYGGPYGGGQQGAMPPPFPQYGYMPPTPNSTSTPIIDPHVYAMYPNFPQYEGQEAPLTPPINNNNNESSLA